jgi:hypothetical protein
VRFSKGPEWSHSTRFEVGTSGRINLEVKSVIRNQRKEQLAGINTYAAEHALGADSRNCPLQLIDDESLNAGADCH